MDSKIDSEMEVHESTRHFRAAFQYCFSRSDFRNRKDVAAAAGISPSTMSEIMTKKSYGIKTQTRIAEVFGYDLIDFLFLGRRLSEGDGGFAFANRTLEVAVRSEREKSMIHENLDEYRGIPLYESGKLAAGANGLIFDPYEEPVSSIIVNQRELTGRMNHRLMGLRVGGPSMRPQIPEGSVVVIDIDDRELMDNRIYAVNYPENGENIAAVKRVRQWKHGFVLISYNPEFPPELSELDWRDLCVGRAVWMWRNLEEL